MNRRKFLAAFTMTGPMLGFSATSTAHNQDSQIESSLFSDALGVAFRQVQARTVEDYPAYWIDDGSVLLFFDWYSVLFPGPDIAKATFDTWAEWISASGNLYDQERPDPFPIGKYEQTSYDLVRPVSNSNGSLDMQGTWGLESSSPQETSIGHLGLAQTGSLVGIQWTHADRPQKCHISWIGNQVFDIASANVSNNPSDPWAFTTEESLLSLLPDPEWYVFNPEVVVSAETSQEWARLAQV